jgi:curved DNA-binding protein
MAMKFQDYYKTLGVSRDASKEEIQAAFRKLARKYHPDVNQSPDAEQRFKEANEAYEVLRDTEKRRRYDELGSNWQAGQEFTPPPGWEFLRTTGRPGTRGGETFDFGGFGGFSDFFRTFFGEGLHEFTRGARTERGASSRSMPGEDVEATVAVSIEDAYHGAQKTITLHSPDTGSSRTYTVKIPPGAVEGARIRLGGQGMPGPGKGKPGDLYLRVHIDKHPVFRLDGHDVHVEVPVTPWEAALGARIEVPTLEGPARMTLPAGSQSGKVLRLRGKGMPRRKAKGEKGNLYVKIRIVVPRNLTESETKHFEALARDSKYNPRKE